MTSRINLAAADLESELATSARSAVTPGHEVTSSVIRWLAVWALLISHSSRASHAKAVAQSLFRDHQAASSNATTSPSTNWASAIGAGADLTRETAITAPMTSNPVST